MQKIAILYDASQAVLSTFNVEEVLEHILAIARDYFHIENAAVLMLDQESNRLVVKTQIGRPIPSDLLSVEMNKGIVGTAARQKRPLYVPDVEKDQRYILAIPGTRSELAIPLILRDEVLGVLDIQSDNANCFDAETIDLLTLFSTQASIALENARLYTLEQRRAAQLEAINIIARQTTAVLDTDELLRKVCKLILGHFQVDHVAILLADEVALHLRAHDGKLTPAMPQGTIIPKTSGLSASALRSGRSVIENDVSKISNYVPGFVETRSEMCVPLIFFGEKLGVVALESEKLGNFRKDDVASLEAVADIVAGAIQNAKYFERAKQLAYVDGLTGIFNRRYFELRIAEELERASRYESQLTVIMIDIDNFKRLNDEFGHLLGDEVLRHVSQIFQQQLRKGDIVCRYGGEEFAIVVPQTAPENAFEAAEKLRRIVESWYFPGVPRKVTISAGLAGFPRHGRTRDEIVASADGALYGAKQGGRNRVVAAASPRVSMSC